LLLLEGSSKLNSRISSHWAARWFLYRPGTITATFSISLKTPEQ